MCAILIHVGLGAAFFLAQKKSEVSTSHLLPFSSPHLDLNADSSAPVKIEAIPNSSDHANPASQSTIPSTLSSLTLSPIDPYFAQIRAKIDRNLVYPVSLQRRGVHGSVTLKLILNSAGSVLQSSVESSSGSDEIDALAMAAVKNALPFPAGTWGSDTMEVHLPIRFQK